MPGRSAYVLRFDEIKEYLVRFDLESDKIVDDIPLPPDSGFQYFAADEQGSCFLAKTRNSSDFCEEIYHYDPQAKKLSRFINLGEITGPSYLTLTHDKLIAVVFGSQALKSHVKGGLVFVSRQDPAAILAKLFIHEKTDSIYQATVKDSYFDGKNRLYLPTLYWENQGRDFGRGEIFVVNTDSMSVEKVISVPKEYNNLSGVAVIGDKLYLACLGKGERGPDGHIPLNDDLLVFSVQSGQLQKKVKVGAQPYKLIYDPSVDKLFIQHMNVGKVPDEIEVISPRSDKIIGRIKVRDSRRVALVAPGRLYASFGSYYTRPGLFIIDSKTDKIIKRFNGDYRGISEKSYVD